MTLKTVPIKTVPFDDCYDEDLEISQAIDEVWEPGHWDLAVKLTGDPKISSLAEIMRHTLYQARFNLKNILHFDSETDMETLETVSWETGAAIIRRELDSLLFGINRIMDLLILMITIIYDIQIPDPEVRFQDFFPRAEAGGNSKSFVIFNELKRKDSILAGQLSAFYFSAENKLLHGLIHQNGLQNPSSSIQYMTLSPHHGNRVSFDSSYTNRQTYIFDAGLVINLEKTYRETVCKFGRIIFNHLNYEPILVHYFSGYQPME